ncbi:MAG TPA: KOW motif-containing protein [Pyrinomonadaceae bacterium]|jgi:transcription antitermination factor NusG|nr:KOW motif-containing protein [Pyrinomonadaceae bacterium]
MSEIESYVKRFTERGWRVFDHAVTEARRRDQNYVSIEHILEALAFEEADLFNALMRDLAAEPRAVRALVEKRLENCPRREGPAVHIAPETIDMLKRAFRRARFNHRSRITPTDIFIALSQDERNAFYELLQGSQVDFEAAVRTIYDLELVMENVRVRIGKRSYAFWPGDQVRIKSGPFASFTGRVEEVDKETVMLKVLVTIFGRAVPLSLRFQDVEKINIRSAA